MIDYSITSNGRLPVGSRSRGHSLTSIQSAIKIRETDKKRKYRYLDTNRFAGFIPLVFGTNGSYGTEATKFFQMMEDDMVANGKIAVEIQSLFPSRSNTGNLPWFNNCPRRLL